MRNTIEFRVGGFSRLISNKKPHPFLNSKPDAPYEESLWITGRALLVDPAPIQFRHDEKITTQTEGDCAFARRIGVSGPKTDENGKIMGFLRYEESGDDDPAKFYLELSFFDCEQWSALWAIAAGDTRLTLQLETHHLAPIESNLPDPPYQVTGDVECADVIPIYGFLISSPEAL